MPCATGAPSSPPPSGCWPRTGRRTFRWSRSRPPPESGKARSSIAVTSGPPPLGAGASDRERLLAFLDAVIDVAARNKSLLSELGHVAPPPSHQQQSENTQVEHPVYRFWHGHISLLIAAQRSDIDAETIAHVLLGSLHSDAILNQLTVEGPDALAAAMRTMVCAILDAPHQDNISG
jgi:hypothetical protein